MITLTESPAPCPCGEATFRAFVRVPAYVVLGARERTLEVWSVGEDDIELLSLACDNCGVSTEALDATPAHLSALGLARNAMESMLLNAQVMTPLER